jgi:hypothetical protein
VSEVASEVGSQRPRYEIVLSIDGLLRCALIALVTVIVVTSLTDAP